MSPYHLAVAFNSGSAFYFTNVTDATRVGLVRLPPVQGRARVRVTTNGAFASGESSIISLRYMSAAGQLILSGAFFTLDSTTVTGAGTIASQELAIGIQPGETYEIQRVYTAGGTPNNPTMSISVQIL